MTDPVAPPGDERVSLNTIEENHDDTKKQFKEKFKKFKFTLLLKQMKSLYYLEQQSHIKCNFFG